MKILQIRGSNLASLAGEFSLDFESGPLADAGLFAIAGPTGAGKSTLLDALCLALYERTPRLDTVSPYQIPDVVEEVLGVNDPRNLLRRGTAEGSAEVRFIGSDGRRYRATWSVRRARKKANARLQPADLQLIDEESNQPIGRTKSEVLAAIERAIGLTFEQFRRSILLAQGDFAAFLKAKGDERSELLERMTGTALYSAISVRAHAKAREIEAALSLQEASANAIVLMDPEARAQLEQQLVALRQQVETLTRQLEVLRTHKAWWETRQTLHARLTEAQGQYAAAEQQWNDAAARRQTLADIEQAQPLRPAHAEAARTAAEYADNERKFSEATAAAATARLHAQTRAQALEAAGTALDAHRASAERLKPELQRARSLDQSIADKSRALDEAKARLDGTRNQLSTLTQDAERLTAQHGSTTEELQQLQGWIESHPRQVALTQSWSAGILPQLQSFQRTSATWKLQCAAIADLEAAHQQATSSLATAQEELAAAEAAIQSAATRVREAEAAEAVHPANQLGERRIAASALRERITSLQDVRQQAHTAQRAIEECSRKLAAAREEAERGRSQSVEAHARLEEVQLQQQQNERLLLQLGLDAHRAALVEGDPCPLCGATHHPGVGPLHETAAELEAQKRHLVARVRELQAQQSGGEALQNTSTARTGELQAEIARHEQELQEGRARWRAQEGQAEPSDPAAGEWLQELLDQRDAEERAITELAAAFDLVRRAAVDARTARDQAGEKERQARRALDTARDGETSAKTKLEQGLAARNAQRQSLDGTFSSLEPTFETIGAWQVDLEADPAAFIRQWNAAVEEAQQMVAAHQRATTTLTQIQSQQAVKANQLHTSSQSAEEQQQLWTRFGDECEALRAERAVLLQGRSVSEVEQELASAQQQTESAHTKALNEDREATSAAAGRDAALVAATTARDQSASAREGAAVRLDEALAAAGIDGTTLQERLARDATWINRERAELNEIDRRRSSEASVVETRAREVQSHEATTAPDQTLEELATALSGQEPQLASLNQQLGAQQTRLNQDNENRALGEQRARELEEARQQARIWQQLDTLIGSADGRKFRKFAQSLTMELLLAHANGELKSLAPRYELQRVKAQDLELQVIDHDMGDEIRSTASLSGGETFLVSLSLALGLSSLASEKVRIESLFVDEGFGTLDPQTLEMALATLDSLQAAGRKVGLISHVPGLAERIGVQVLVDRQGQGASSVRVVNGWS